MLYLHGTGHFHPENIIDNRFLESLDIGVDASWVRQRVGTEERRTVLPLDYIRHTRNADPRAADEAVLEDAGTAGSDRGAIEISDVEIAVIAKRGGNDMSLAG